jgi:5'(3')-deoxyribonucleotidase
MNLRDNKWVLDFNYSSIQSSVLDVNNFLKAKQIIILTWYNSYMAHVAFDVDGVLYPNFLNEFQEYASSRGYEATSPLTTWHLWDHYGISEAEFFILISQAVNAGAMFVDGDPHPEAREVLNQMATDGHHIYAVTARHVIGSEILARRLTISWLETHLKVPWTGILITERKDILPFHAILDDAIHNCDAIENIGGMGVCYSQPWNEEYDGFRVGSLWEFRDLVDKHYPLKDTK